MFICSHCGNSVPTTDADTHLCVVCERNLQTVNNPCPRCSCGMEQADHNEWFCYNCGYPYVRNRRSFEQVYSLTQSYMLSFD